MKNRTKSGLRKLQKFTSNTNWWPWLILAMGSGDTAAQGASGAAQLLHEDLGEQKTEPHRQAGKGWQPELDHFVQDLGAAGTAATLFGGQVASPGMMA